jgi:hypothetical protein
VKGEVKSMQNCFHIKEIVHEELILAGQTVNSAYYVMFSSDCVNMCKDFATNFGDKKNGS